MPFVALLALPLMLVGTTAAQAAPAVTVQSSDGEIALGTHLELAEDPSHDWTIETLLTTQSPLPFAVNGNSAPYLGFSASTWWVRVALKNASEKPLKRLVEFGFPLLDDVVLYAQRRHSVQALGSSGFKVPFAARPIAHRTSQQHLSGHYRCQRNTRALRKGALTNTD